MILQKLTNKRSNEKVYYKYCIVIPPKIIKRLNWHKGIDLDMVIENNEAIIKPKNLK